MLNTIIHIKPHILGVPISVPIGTCLCKALRALDFATLVYTLNTRTGMLIGGRTRV